MSYIPLIIGLVNLLISIYRTITRKHNTLNDLALTFSMGLTGSVLIILYYLS